MKETDEEGKDDSEKKDMTKEKKPTKGKMSGSERKKAEGEEKGEDENAARHRDRRLGEEETIVARPRRGERDWPKVEESRRGPGDVALCRGGAAGAASRRF